MVSPSLYQIINLPPYLVSTPSISLIRQRQTLLHHQDEQAHCIRPLFMRWFATPAPLTTSNTSPKDPRWLNSTKTNECVIQISQSHSKDTDSSMHKCTLG